MTRSVRGSSAARRLPRFARAVWPTVPEPVDAATYRRTFHWWWLPPLLFAMNVATYLSTRHVPGQNLPPMEAFLRINFAFHTAAVAVCWIGQLRFWSDSALRRLTWTLLVFEYLSGLGGFWLAGGSAMALALNTFLFALVAAFARAYYDAKTGLFALAVGMALLVALSAGETLGWVPLAGPANFNERAVYESQLPLRTVGLGWEEVLIFLTWFMTSHVVKRLRETDWALATERAARRRLEERVREAGEGGARSGTELPNGFAIGELLGRGAMGEVYEARSAESGETVAVKVLHGHLATSSLMMERFQREVEILSRLPDSFIARLLDRGNTEDGAPFFVMERLRGEDLGVRLRRTGRMSRDEAILILGRLAAGLDAAHQSGVVHRDLKPQNVFLCEGLDAMGRPRIKLLDFGISRLIDDESRALTGPAWVLGSPGYLSPEQARGDNRHVGPKTDVFALGAVAYRMLTGRVAFRARDMAGAVFESLHTDPAPASSIDPAIPSAVSAVLALALAKSMDVRYAHAGEFINDLERAFEGRLPTDVEKRGRALLPSEREASTVTEAATALDAETAGKRSDGGKPS